jgi:hypothetical protein
MDGTGGLDDECQVQPPRGERPAQQRDRALGHCAERDGAGVLLFIARETQEARCQIAEPFDVLLQGVDVGGERAVAPVVADVTLHALDPVADDRKRIVDLVCETCRHDADDGETL